MKSTMSNDDIIASNERDIINQVNEVLGDEKTESQ